MSHQSHLAAGGESAQAADGSGTFRVGDDGSGRAADAPSGRTRDPGRKYRIQQSGLDIFILFAVLLGASVVYAVIRPASFAFLTSANIQIGLQAIPLLGVAALGVGLLMIAGEFDLSVGANSVFTSILMAQLNADYGMNVWLAMLIGLAAGLAIGLLNGLITLWLRIPSFITTLGTMGIWAAAVLFIHGASSQAFNAPPAFNSLMNGSIGPIPAVMIWFLGLAVACWGLLQRHRIGNHLFAVGGDRQAATATGVRIRPTKMVAFGLAGVLGAFSGILSAAQVGNISPLGGTDLPLQAIAACVIGGALLTGGRGTILGIVLGSSLIYWIQDVLLLLGAPGYYLTAFIGALTIAAVVVYQALQARRA